MPDNESCGLKFSLPERELLANLLMGSYELDERIEQTPLDGEVDFSAAELDLLDDILAIELEHMKSRDHRRMVAQIRKRIALLMSL